MDRELQFNRLKAAVCVTVVGALHVLLAVPAFANTSMSSRLPPVAGDTADAHTHNIAEGKAKRAGRPSDLGAYSLRFWPRNSLIRGRMVSAQTPYGLLTCSSNGPDRPRSCTLE